MLDNQEMAAWVYAEPLNAIVCGEKGRTCNFGELPGTLVNAERANAIIEHKKIFAGGINEGTAFS